MVTLASSLFLVTLLFSFSTSQTNRTTLVGYGGMVVSGHYLATEAGLEILKQGGNAADAAVAVQMALTVTEQQSSGIGGGCFILYYDSSQDEVYSIDGREEAPELYDPYIFCKCYGKPNCTEECNNESDYILSNTNRKVGGLSNGVPGTVYAMHLLHQNFGKKKWSSLFKSAIKLAEDGFPMYERLYNTINQSRNTIAYFKASYDLYFHPNGSAKAEINETWYNKDLAETMRILGKSTSENAIKEFYTGDLAMDILNATLNAFSPRINRSGVMSYDDISNYRAVFRENIISEYKTNNYSYEIYGMNMPSSGGLSVATMLNMLQSLSNDPYFTSYSNTTDSKNEKFFEKISNNKIYNLDIYDADVIHTLISLSNIAFSDRNYYHADADFINVPVEGLMNQSYNRQRLEELLRWDKLDVPVKFGDPPGFNGSIYSNEGNSGEYGTTHFNVVDKWGNIACITSTIEGSLGSQVVVPNRGFLLNNELTDFNIMGYDENGDLVANGPSGERRKRRTALNIDSFGISNDSESIGGKRPRSSMSPTIVFKKNGTIKEAFLAIGSPGGSTIIDTTFQTLLKIIFWDINTQEAIDASRLYSPNVPQVSIESQMFTQNPNLRIDLMNKSYNKDNLVPFPSLGSVQGIKMIKNKNNINILYGGADSLRRQVSSVLSLCSKDNYSDVKNIGCNNSSNNISRMTVIVIIISCICFVTILFLIFIYINRFSLCKICYRSDSFTDIDDKEESDTRQYQNEFNIGVGFGGTPKSQSRENSQISSRKNIDDETPLMFEE